MVAIKPRALLLRTHPPFKRFSASTVMQVYCEIAKEQNIEELGSTEEGKLEKGGYSMMNQ